MGKRKINLWMVFLSGIGALLGFVLGEMVLNNLGDRIPSVWLMGIYFGILAFCIGIMCLLAEMISPKLNGRNWRVQYLGSSWLYLIPATFILLFAVGSLFQFLYELDFQGRGKPNDVLMLIDVSGSMEETDPNDDRLRAAADLVSSMGREQRAAIIAFDDQTYMIQPMTYITDGQVQQEIQQKIFDFEGPMGGTAFEAALRAAMEHLQESAQKRRSPMVILLSDGYSEMDMETVLAPYIEKEITVHTIGLTDPLNPSYEGHELLEKIGAATGGNFYSIENTQDISQIFQTIYEKETTQWLVGAREGAAARSVYSRIFRILWMTGIGICIGLGVAIIFDNRYLARAYVWGGSIGGILAGIILEAGFSANENRGWLYRLISAMVLGILFTLFSWFIKLGEDTTRFRGREIAGQQSGSDSERRGGRRSF